jgi:tRNA (mo5U34)-methyltransferase
LRGGPSWTAAATAGNVFCGRRSWEPASASASTFGSIGFDQARFLLEHYQGPTEGVRFETCGLYDLPPLDPFDMTFFHGVFYHLSDPVHGLRIASDLTREVIYMNTATKIGEEGALLAATEDPEKLLAGAERLIWYPTGPKVMNACLKSCGFVEAQVLVWNEDTEQTPGLGRLEIVASKVPGLLKDSYAL